MNPQRRAIDVFEAVARRELTPEQAAEILVPRPSRARRIAEGAVMAVLGVALALILVLDALDLLP